MIRLVPLALLLALLPSCSLFSAPDAGPAAEAIARMAEVHTAQANAFRSFAQAARFDDDPAEDARKRALVLAGIDKDSEAFASLRGSVDRWLAEVGEIGVDDLVKLGREFYEKWKQWKEGVE